MIRLTRLDGSEVIVNSDLIELIESTPDTIISLTTNRKLLVKEPPHEIIDRTVSYRRRTSLQPSECLLQRSKRRRLPVAKISKMYSR